MTSASAATRGSRLIRNSISLALRFRFELVECLFDPAPRGKCSRPADRRDAQQRSMFEFRAGQPCLQSPSGMRSHCPLAPRADGDRKLKDKKPFELYPDARELRVDGQVVKMVDDDNLHSDIDSIPSSDGDDGAGSIQ